MSKFYQFLSLRGAKRRGNPESIKLHHSRLPRCARNDIFLFYILLFCLGGFSAHANGAALDYTAFKQIPILHDGRVKPLDTFARAYLHRLHGSQTVDDQSAAQWLAQSVFRPDLAVSQPFITIPNHRVMSALELPYKKSKRYSYSEVAGAYAQKRGTIIALIKKGEANLNQQEQEFLGFYSIINDYSHITRALTLALPSQPNISEDLAKKANLDGTERTYLDFLKARDRIVQDAEAAVKKHGNKLEKYSKNQQEAALLAFYFAKMEATGKQNSLFRIIPAFLGDRSEWHAPWALLNKGQGSPEGFALLEDWKHLAVAYRAQDAAAWDKFSKQIRSNTSNVRSASDVQLSLEVWYHQLNPTLWIMLAYGLAFLILLILSIIRPSSQRRLDPKGVSATSSNEDHKTKEDPSLRWDDRIKKLPVYLLGAGALIHTVMIITRVTILERPPVGTLYESVLFVALVAVLLAWKLDKSTNANEGKLIGSLLGVFLVGISGLFAAEGDTLGVLVAVLNTNFWLATHVVCITIGYGCAMVAGTMAHVYLMNLSDSVGKKLQTTALIALLFTAIGTILGGIWADQSWGRFWGWDPKENGALAIVLWLIWLLHGRITGHFKLIGFAACLAVTNIVVALSWFGVNLLSVGLHSYGFTDNAALGLGAFCFGELAIIIGLIIHAKRLQKHAH